MEGLLYSPPHGGDIFAPSLEYLERIVLVEDEDYWRVGSGTAGLEIVRKKRAGVYEKIDSEPALMFFMEARHGFFCTYFEPKGTFVEQFVPSSGSTGGPWVKHVVGGLPMYVPRACFVPRPVGWEVVSEFWRVRRRSPLVPWVNRDSLDFRDPEVNPPAVEDLV